MSFGPIKRKADEPCNSYFGNLCSGFGGTMVCMFCGWGKFDHPLKNYEQVVPPNVVLGEN